MAINMELAKQQQLTQDEIEKIEALHAERHKLYSDLASIKKLSYNEAQRYIEKLTSIEFALQELWGFKQDARYHRFWLIPHCSCPQLDNEFWIGTDRRIYNYDCIFHGMAEQLFAERASNKQVL